ncbi:Succinylglutamate desuccinylase / Aspartoacylase family protein [Methanosarcina barkeri str. Wiesmoor]|uniref:Succinylglutamate desuccinylase / Aspartoacylase family protein n=2 Tax=Methanosarcina barkeri TaxID=2208 RepID=A0A0E3QLK6_METBA|nr:succinylglutamate desuccinylase/aspartoacylase family protein [Methanosarcina barkeri]AKB51100.1 Succinylglutamate desuccinylase / Aspartoacylase family protein [Methanosarcina barkeri str. Wiesmoor]
MNIPVYVICGTIPEPCIFVTAAIHGDEINGIEIIRQLLESSAIRHIYGTLIASACSKHVRFYLALSLSSLTDETLTVLFLTGKKVLLNPA